MALSWFMRKQHERRCDANPNDQFARSRLLFGSGQHWAVRAARDRRYSEKAREGGGK